VNITSDQTGWVNNQANIKACYVKVKEEVPPKPVEPKPLPPAEITKAKGDVLPITGPVETAAAAFGTLGLSGSAVAWLRSKKRLLDSFRK
jgi:hypothetical protein